MARPRKTEPTPSPEAPAPQALDQAPVVVFRPIRKDGWFAYQKLEIPAELLADARVVYESEPDILAITSEQFAGELMDAFGL